MTDADARTETEIEIGSDGPEPPPGRETALDSEGYVYDVVSGEVVGREDTHELFEVQDLESAEWVLKLLSELEGDVAGLHARKAALVKQFDALVAAKVRRLAWWEYRFRPSLVRFARSALAGTARTWSCPWGSVSFRRTRGSSSILDDAAAVDFVEAWAPSRVRVLKSVTVKDVLAARETAERATGEPEPTPFLAQAAPGESVTVSTGIEVKGGAK